MREGLRLLGFDDATGLEIHHQGDLPARAGMGSSSAFAVGLIKALTALRGQMIGKPELARQAIELEQDRAERARRLAGPVAAAYGGLNVIHFPPDGDIRVIPVTIPPARVDGAAEPAAPLLPRLEPARVRDRGRRRGQPRSAARRPAPHARAWSTRALAILTGGGDLDAFGRLLHEGWMLKRRLSRAVSTEAVDRVYQTAMDHGALGGKLLGAGGTGFMLFYVPQDRQAEVVESLPACVHVPFQFESEGSRSSTTPPTPR